MTARELLERLHDAYNSHDAAGAAMLYHDDGRHAEAAHGGERVGRPAMTAGLQRLFAGLPGVAWERLWIIEEGDRAAAGYRLKASVAGSDGTRAVELQGVHVLTCAEGLIMRTDDYWDRESLRAQLVEPERESEPERPTGALKVAHTCYRTADLAGALDFYRRLGFQEQRRFETGDAELHVFLGLAPAVEELELVTGLDRTHRPSGHLHVGILAQGLDDWLGELARDGLKPVAAPGASRPGVPRICVMQDPDGNMVELIEASE